MAVYQDASTVQQVIRIILQRQAAADRPLEAGCVMLKAPMEAAVAVKAGVVQAISIAISRKVV